MISTANSVGRGVPRPRATTRPKQTVTNDGNVLPDDWSDTPIIANQISQPDLWKPDHIEIKVFDLSKEDDVKAYGELMTKIETGGANVFAQEHRVEKFDDVNNWKVFLRLLYVKYRRIIKPKTNN